ncbi:substrate-binding domain-containing protein [Sorangium sp. So ce1097]|uniref:substrate-binding domain-containing protein n=1 Tax=Sorangium sp. So ce1097 TaxID=3133330 RepID=UPI003F5DE3FF
MSMTGRCRMAAFGLAVMTAACGASESQQAGEQVTPIKRAELPPNEFFPVELEATVDALVAEMNANPIQPMQMVVLLKELDGFFAPIATGANRAMGELGVTGNVLGPNTATENGPTSQELQNQQIRQAVADGAQGIGVSPFDTSNAAALDEAVANGAHVVTLDTDASASQRSLYVGSFHGDAGGTAATTLLSMLPPPPGTVLIHGNVTADWADGYARTQGAQGVLAAAGYTPLVSQAVFIGDDAFDVEWMRSQMVAADPPVVGMVGLFNISYRCVMAADAAGTPDLPIVAFDFDPRTVDFMRQGRIKATHTQRQYYEGYLVPYILYGIESIGLDATRTILRPLMEDGVSQVNVGIDVVPSDKIDDYNDFLASIGSIQ